MKAIMEYNVTGSLNGKVTYYPKNNHKVPLTKTITSVLESFESKKKAYTNWEKYDYFLNNIMKEYPNVLNKKMFTEINKQKEEYQEMTETQNFYTKEDYEQAIKDIDSLYLNLIHEVETKTKTKFGIDFTLE